MSRHRRAKAVMLRDDRSPELSEESLKRISELKAVAGSLNHVGIFHEQFCADALRRGAKKCLCTPDIRILDQNNPKDARIWQNLGL